MNLIYTAREPCGAFGGQFVKCPALVLALMPVAIRKRQTLSNHPSNLGVSGADPVTHGGGLFYQMSRFEGAFPIHESNIHCPGALWGI
jgi:hypothetical protein